MKILLPRSPPVNGASRREGFGDPRWLAESLRPAAPRRLCQSPDLLSLCASVLLCVVILVLFLSFSEACQHWFVIPVLVCGVLIGMDLVDWLRGRMDLFDPIGLIGALGFHGFFLAPLLHVSVNYWMPYIEPPSDWREWLGKMGFINVAGLGVYLAVSRLWLGLRHPPPRRIWQVRHPGLVLCAALLLTSALQSYVYLHFGGISGYVALYEREADMGKSSFTGWGWVFIVSESFPRLAFVAFTLLLWRRGKPSSWGVLVLGLVVFFGLLILFGGLRGSRSNIIWSMFWALAVTHFCLRPIPRKFVLPGIAGLLGFMILYSAFKHGGTKDFQRAVTGQATQRGSNLTRVSLGDLARSDVQAFLLYRMSRPGTDYELAWGRTYLGAAALLIPEALWPERPPSKVQEGTWILWGRSGSIYKASNLYGLGGETMLNFGPAVVPLAFGVFALLLGVLRSWIYGLHPRDGRVFLLPVFVSLSILGLVCDSDNVVFFLFQYGGMLGVVLLLICRPSARPAAARGAS